MLQEGWHALPLDGICGTIKTNLLELKTRHGQDAQPSPATRTQPRRAGQLLSLDSQYCYLGYSEYFGRARVLRAQSVCVAVESNSELETCSWLHAGYDFGTDTSNYDSVNAKPVADSSRPKPMAMAMAEPTGPPPDMPV